MSAPWRAPYAGTRTLVLGASGFIGRWVARELVEAGADVTVTVRHRAAAEPVLTQWSIRARVIDTAFTARSDVQRVLDAARPDIVFNLVGYGVDRSERDAATMQLLNRDLTQWLADELAQRASPAWDGVRLIGAGSALEYGRCGGVLAEDVEPRPFNAYGETKLAGTLAMRETATRTGLRAVTARLFTVYGPGEHAGRLLPSLLDAAQQRQPVRLSSGDQQRDFTYVGEVAEGLLRIGVSRISPGEVINLGTGTLATVRDFVLAAAGVIGLPEASLRFGALAPRPDEMPHERVVVQRLQQVTGWRPSAPIAQGVRAAQAFMHSLASTGAGRAANL